MAFTNRMFQLIEPFLKQVQDIEDMWRDVKLLRSISSATGQQLDNLGVILDVAREGKTDGEYEVALLAKILVNRGHGVPSVVIDFITEITQSSVVEYQISPPAGVKIWVNGDDDVVSGSHDGSSGAAILTDSTALFVTNGLIKVGQAIFNLTDKSFAIITSFTETTISGTLGGGQDNDWDSADVFDIPIITYAKTLKQQVHAVMPAGVLIRNLIYLNSKLSPFNNDDEGASVSVGNGFLELGYDEVTNGYTAGAYSEAL